MTTNIYDVSCSSSDSLIALGNGTNSRCGIKVKNGVANNKHISQIGWDLDRNGTGGAGTLSCKVRKVSDDSVLYTSPTTLAQTSVTTVVTLWNFTFDYTPNSTDGDVIITIESSGSDATNWVAIRYKADTTTNFDKAVYTGTWAFDTANDIGGQIQSDGVRVSMSESFTISDTLSRLLSALRSQSDSVTISDTLSRVPIYIRTITNTIVISDSLTVMLNAIRSLSNSITISDVLSITKGVVTSISESTVFSDVVSRLVGVIRNPTDSLVFSDIVTHVLASFRSTTESI